mmetsp:Transcript_19228/g.46299  ORF Transcript_19228/g.46299 Transcript_19228/m.46299 type:complete len:211 (+) Transcript_19228:29-661(+)
MHRDDEEPVGEQACTGQPPPSKSQQHKIRSGTAAATAQPLPSRFPALAPAHSQLTANSKSVDLHLLDRVVPGDCGASEAHYSLDQRGERRQPAQYVISNTCLYKSTISASEGVRGLFPGDPDASACWAMVESSESNRAGSAPNCFKVGTSNSRFNARSSATSTSHASFSDVSTDTRPMARAQSAYLPAAADTENSVMAGSNIAFDMPCGT